MLAAYYIFFFVSVGQNPYDGFRGKRLAKQEMG